MAHINDLLPPSEFLGPQDFQVPREVTISRVAKSEMPERDSKKAPEVKPCLWIIDKTGAEYPRKLKLPPTMLKVIGWILGTDYKTWAGKKITLKATWCLSFREVQECVRPQLSEAMTRKIRNKLKDRKVNADCWECDPPAVQMDAEKPLEHANE